MTQNMLEEAVSAARSAVAAEGVKLVATSDGCAVLAMFVTRALALRPFAVCGDYAVKVILDPDMLGRATVHASGLSVVW